MLKIRDFVLDGNILSMTVLIEGDEEQAYRMSVDVTTEYFDVVSSEFSDYERMYESQACMALTRYRGKELPEVITSMWY